MKASDYVVSAGVCCEVVEVDEKKQIVTLRDMADNVFSIALPVYRHSFVALEIFLEKLRKEAERINKETTLQGPESPQGPEGGGEPPTPAA